MEQQWWQYQQPFRTFVRKALTECLVLLRNIAAEVGASQSKPPVGFRFPIATTREGIIVMADYQLPSNLLGYWPITVGGKVPPSTDSFTLTNVTGPFTATISAVPAQTPPGPTDGDPAVEVTPNTLEGLVGCTFTINDSAGDPVDTVTFDIVPPPEPIGTAAVVTAPNPAPPTS